MTTDNTAMILHDKPLIVDRDHSLFVRRVPKSHNMGDYEQTPEAALWHPIQPDHLTEAVSVLVLGAHVTLNSLAKLPCNAPRDQATFHPIIHHSRSRANISQNGSSRKVPVG